MTSAFHHGSIDEFDHGIFCRCVAILPEYSALSPTIDAVFITLPFASCLSQSSSRSDVNKHLD
jgi:hypothetical protein